MSVQARPRRSAPRLINPQGLIPSLATFPTHSALYLYAETVIAYPLAALGAVVKVEMRL